MDIDILAAYSKPAGICRSLGRRQHTEVLQQRAPRHSCCCKEVQPGCHTRDARVHISCTYRRRSRGLVCCDSRRRQEQEDIQVHAGRHYPIVSHTSGQQRCIFCTVGRRCDVMQCWNIGQNREFADVLPNILEQRSVATCGRQHKRDIDRRRCC